MRDPAPLLPLPLPCSRVNEDLARLADEAIIEPGHLLQVVESGQRDGQLAAAASASDIAALLFSVFESSVRHGMLGETPAADEGLATLHRRLKMLKGGLR